MPAVGIPAFDARIKGWSIPVLGCLSCNSFPDQFNPVIKVKHGIVFEAMPVIGEEDRLADGAVIQKPAGNVQMPQMKGIEPSADQGCGIIRNG